MMKKLKYIEGISDKFWKIRTDGINHTVIYGKNGTISQSKQRLLLLKKIVSKMRRS